VSEPGERNEWFWTPVTTFGLAPLLKTGYGNISHAVTCVLSERWHEETDKVHLSIGEIIVTLDDVECLLDIPIIGRLIEETELTHERGIELLENELLFTEENAMEEVKKQYRGYVNYTKLKRRCETLLNKCNQLEEPASDEATEE